MKPKRIILIRHGESMANRDYAIHASIPDHKVHLSSKGTRQAIEAGMKLGEIIKDESVQFYVSPFLRTRQTLNGILESFPGKQRIYESDDIREQEWGHLRTKEETAKIEAERDYFGTYFFRIPDGESGADVCTRVAVFMNTLHRDFEKHDFPENAVIVTHGLTLRLFCKRWFHWTVEEYEKLKNPKNCEIFVMERYEADISNRNMRGFTYKYKLITPFRQYPPTTVIKQFCGKCARDSEFTRRVLTKSVEMKGENILADVPLLFCNVCGDCQPECSPESDTMAPFYAEYNRLHPEKK